MPQQNINSTGHLRYWSFRAIESPDKNGDGEKSNENKNEYEWIRLGQG